MVVVVHGSEVDLIVNPVSLPFVEGLNYLVEFLVSSLVVVLKQVHQIALLEITAHPILFGTVSQQSVTLENSIFELPSIQVPILEKLLSKTCKLGVLHVPPFNYSKLELIFISMSFWVVASVAALEDDGEA